VRVLLGLRQQPSTRRLNAILLAATLAATAATWLIAPSEQRAWLSFSVFVAGHFVWSSVFAWLALFRFDAAFIPVHPAVP
jgi:hypothetical protein